VKDGCYERRWTDEHGHERVRMVAVRGGFGTDLRKLVTRPLSWWAALPGSWRFVQALGSQHEREGA
jgi:hypothetical protein